MTEQKQSAPAPATSYREMKIGDTTFRITSVYLGQKDLKTTLEQLTVKRVLAELSTGKPA
ncbi:hypothetical protein FACS1894191_7140 [Clostridia bacterium]|nr:hypothetical protein FACS1894191_7140 [Clostridia bacterium]